ncbi:MAG: TIGR03960 family B12-binding radical SAM protein [Desulfomicrobiaceae bacterium]|nr:TIGR03960 family B12-binding radical SAM protein [Desulfomicrobiaceae bacterium]
MKELLPLFSRPSHYLGTEIGAVHKEAAAVRVHVALAFPDLYEVGMSYLGQRILYGVLNAQPWIWAERVFAPSPDVGELLRSRQVPLATLESDTPLGRLDAVLVSLTHELCYTTVLWMLELAGIALRAADRGQADPLVVAGGGCVFNAEPLAPFVDVMVLGDGEEAVLDLARAVDQAKAAGWSRQELLAHLSEIPGFYVPAFFTPDAGGRMQGPAVVRKRAVPHLDATPFPTQQIVPFGKPVHDRLTVEIARGCTRGCRFCQAGMIYRPVRERAVSTVTRLIKDGLAATGSEEVSFLSLSTGDFTGLTRLFAETYSRCRAEQVSIALPSLRVGSVPPELMALLASIRRTGLTLAPEAGTQRLRDVINKGITEEALLRHTSQAFALGWQQVKLYFMIGLPTETDEDLLGIIELCRKVAETAPSRKRLQVTAAVSPFVPKAHTPFQWEAQISRAEVERRIAFLRQAARPYKFVRLKWHSPAMTFLEGVFSRGDRALAPVIEAALARGAVLSSWEDHLQLDRWMEAFAACGVDPEAYLAARDPHAPLPWDHLSSGVTREFLLRERARALAGKTTPDCRFGACRACGVCPGEDEALAPRLQPETEAEAEAVAPAVEQVDLTAREARFRIVYSVLGPAVYLSQLELQRLFERAFRRARIPLAFSAGFHPAPLMSFSRALPVGVGSLCEGMEIFTREWVSPQAMATLVSAELPTGMRVVEVTPLPLTGKMAEAVEEDFEVTCVDPTARWRLADQWAAFQAASSWVVEKPSKRGSRSVDVRAMVQAVREVENGWVVTFSWETEGYASPLWVLRAVDPDFDLAQVRVVKVARRMEAGRATEK